ncbi:MAG: MaoC family dehydratase N-terminal domain-containing protein [Actinomycetota bacterium]|nr:MaoC family dehydratase N-terminal domain-containing protein [Actinomycetota bacterium]
MAATVRFDDVKVGDEIPVHAKVVKREDVKAYADASGDQNPLHQDDNFARSVGFPGIIAHGMFTMAHLTTGLTRWLGDPAALKAIGVQFRAVVFMDETIEAGGTIAELDPGTKRAKLDVWVRVERAGVSEYPIKNSRAEVELA